MCQPSHPTDAQLWVDYIREAANPKPIEENPAVVQALAFNQTVLARSGIDYTWVFDYAKDRYAEAAAIRDSLDDKASEIIKYLGGGAGVLTVGAILGAKPENYWLMGWVIPAFVAAIHAMWFAIQARRPSASSIPPTIAVAKTYADEGPAGEQGAQTAFLGQINLTCQQMHAQNEIKARQVSIAIHSLFVAVCFAPLPILAALFCHS